MDTLASRLRHARDLARMSQAALASKLNVGQSTIASIENGRNQASRHLVAIAQALDVDPIWLASGKGAPKKSVTASLEGGDVLVWERPEDLPPDENRVWVDRWDYSCSAGDGMIQWEVRQKSALPFTSDLFRAIGCKPETCKLVMVRGDSMEPFLFDRDMIMVDTSRTEPRDGGIYAVVFEGEALVKQIFKEQGGAFTLHSLNPAFRDKRIEPGVEGNFTVVGEVKYRSGGGFAG